MGHKGQSELLEAEDPKALAGVNEVQQLCRAETTKSVETLVKLRDDVNVPPSVRRLAANNLLAWGWLYDTSQWRGGAGTGDGKGGVQFVINLVSFTASGEKIVTPLPMQTRVLDVMEEARKALTEGGPA